MLVKKKYTKVPNEFLEALIQLPFRGCEFQAALFIIRKTVGFHKEQDEISISQFEKALQRSRPTIIKALKNLQLVKVAKLVRQSKSKRHSNLWAINLNPNDWDLVKVAKLVKCKSSIGKGVFTPTSKDAFTHKRKKENTKESEYYKTHSSSIDEILRFYYEWKDYPAKREVEEDEIEAVIKLLKYAADLKDPVGEIKELIRLLYDDSRKGKFNWTIKTAAKKFYDYFK